MVNCDCTCGPCGSASDVSKRRGSPTSSGKLLWLSCFTRLRGFALPLVAALIYVAGNRGLISPRVLRAGTSRSVPTEIYWLFVYVSRLPFPRSRGTGATMCRGTTGRPVSASPPIETSNSRIDLSHEFLTPCFVTFVSLTLVYKYSSRSKNIFDIFF